MQHIGQLLCVSLLVFLKYRTWTFFHEKVSLFFEHKAKKWNTLQGIEHLLPYSANKVLAFSMAASVMVSPDSIFAISVILPSLFNV